MRASQLNARVSEDFAAKLAQTETLLKQAAIDYTSDDGGTVLVTQASSLGAEDVVISHLINTLGLPIAIFVLDTGKLHAETLQLLERTQGSFKVPVNVFKPDQDALLRFVTREGPQAMFKSIALRKACCQIRKMEPLTRALAGKTAWITGLRREQSGARADVPLLDTSDASRVKINPLAHWTWGDVWHFIAVNRVPYNPLHDQFYPSIGCAPCTRAVSQGEDFRSGRWWWEDESSKECGLHVAASPASDSREEIVTL